MDHVECNDEFFLEENYEIESISSKLPAEPSTKAITEERRRLEKVLDMVTRKVSELVLKNQPSYVEELQRIADLQKAAAESIRVCGQGRKCLDVLRNGPAKNAMTIVKNNRERNLLKGMLEFLNKINELKHMVDEMPIIINEDKDYPSAIEKCRTAKQIASQYMNFNCVTELDRKIDNTLEYISEQVDYALCSMYPRFDSKLYNKLLVSYKMMKLDDTEINKKTLSFFRNYHNSALEELKIFLEQELWEKVPVSGTFKLMKLKEFYFLRKSGTTEDILDENDDEQDLTISSLDDIYKPLQLNDLLSDDEDDSDEELAAELNKANINEDEFLTSDDEFDSCVDTTLKSAVCSLKDEHNLSTYSTLVGMTARGPIFTNSSLTVLRLIGRYTQMMIVLKPISYEILLGIYNLIDNYTYAVFNKFGPENDVKLQTFIKSVKESFLSNEPQDKSLSAENLNTILLIEKNSSLLSQQKSSINVNKLVAIESLVVLVNQVWNLHEYLESLISPDMRSELREHFSHDNTTNNNLNNNIIPDFLKVRVEMGIEP